MQLPQSYEDWRDTSVRQRHTSKGVAFTRWPLELALSISPLILFTQYDLAAHRHAKESVMRIHRALGSERPLDLWHVEKMIWNLLLKLQSDMELLSHPDQWLNEVPENVINGASSLSDAFFKTRALI